jgi:hypothetical protein
MGYIRGLLNFLGKWPDGKHFRIFKQHEPYHDYSTLLCSMKTSIGGPYTYKHSHGCIPIHSFYRHCTLNFTFAICYKIYFFYFLELLKNGKTIIDLQATEKQVTD